MGPNQRRRQRRRQKRIEFRQQVEQIAREIIEEIRNEGNQLPIEISLLASLYNPFIYSTAEVDCVISNMEEYIPLTVSDRTVPIVEGAKVV